MIHKFLDFPIFSINSIFKVLDQKQYNTFRWKKYCLNESVLLDVVVGTPLHKCGHRDIDDAICSNRPNRRKLLLC